MKQDKPAHRGGVTRRKALALLGAASAIAPPPSLAGNGQDVQIGAVLPLSGPSGSYGQVMVSGMKIAVEHINDDKMIAGKFSIAYEDSQGLPQQGVIGMNKLVNVEKVPYVISANAGVLKAISVIGGRSHTVVVNGAAVAPDLATLGEHFWNMLPLLTYEVRVLAPYLVKERGFKRFVVIYADEPGSDAARKELQAAASAAGGQIVGALSIPPTGQQFAGIAAKVRELKGDVIFLASFGAQQVQLVKQLRENGVSQQIVSYSVFSLPELLVLPEAKGALYTSRTISYGSPDPVTRRFVDAYKAANQGKLPPVYAVNYYNAVYLFGQLARELQKKNKPITGENLLAQRLETKSFDFVGGRVSFEANGTVKAPMQINEIHPAGGKTIAVMALQ